MTKHLKKSRVGNYVIFDFGQIKDPERLAEKIINNTLEMDHVYKDTKRNYVSSFRLLENDCCFLKIPRGRDSRVWERILALFRGGESMRYAKSMMRLHQLGIKGPMPVLCGQRRYFGMILNSFIVYKPVLGTPPTDSDAATLVQTLSTLHDQGYLRRDAHARNFVITDEGAAFIDFRLSKPLFMRKARQTEEMLYLADTLPAARSFIIDDIENALSFRLYTSLKKVKVSFMKLKRKLRELVSYRTKVTLD